MYSYLLMSKEKTCFTKFNLLNCIIFDNNFVLIYLIGFVFFTNFLRIFFFFWKTFVFNFNFKMSGGEILVLAAKMG